MPNVFSPLFDAGKPSAFTSVAGVTNAIFAQYTDGSRCIYDQLFKIFDYFGLKYFLFAGSMVGYVRDGKMPAWMDDLDIMIFEDQIPTFEQRIVPYLKAAGFNARPPALRTPGRAGYHILALQQGSSRDLTISYADEVDVKVPWAQVDVFYSAIDGEGFLRNPANWGLYHEKRIPADWVRPGKVIEIDGWMVPVFSEYERDILKEYGDVKNNLVVSSHDKTFLRVDNAPWIELADQFDALYRRAPMPFPPGISEEVIGKFTPMGDVKYSPREGESFQSIVQSIISHNASAVVLTQSAHLYWVMDLRRIFPELKIHGEIQSTKDVSRATHLRKFYDSITAESQEISEVISSQIEYLKIA